MTTAEPIANKLVATEKEEICEPSVSSTLIERLLQKLSCLELPAKGHLERYMRHKWRINHKPRTLASSFTSVMRGQIAESVPRSYL